VLDRNLSDRLQVRWWQNATGGVLRGIDDNEACTMRDEAPQLINV
jgi:hypothetical protein